MNVYIGVSGMSKPELATAGPEALGRYLEQSGADQLHLMQTNRLMSAYAISEGLQQQTGAVSVSPAPRWTDIVPRFLERRRRPDLHGEMTWLEAGKRAVGNTIQRANMPSAPTSVKKLPQLDEGTRVIFGPEHIGMLEQMEHSGVLANPKLMAVSPDTVSILRQRNLATGDDAEQIADAFEQLGLKAVISPFDMRRSSMPHVSGEANYRLPRQDEMVYELAHRGLIGMWYASLNRTDAPESVGKEHIERSQSAHATLTELATYITMATDRAPDKPIDTVLLGGQLHGVDRKELVQRARTILN